VRKYRKRRWGYDEAFAVIRINQIEAVGFRFDIRDNFFTWPFPPCGKVADVCDVFLQAVRMRVVDTGDSDVSHDFTFTVF
jgi:hypothetical protein